MWCVFDNGDPQRIMISQIPLLLVTFAEALNLLNIIDLEDVAVQLPLLKEKGNEYSPLRMCVDAAARIAFGKGSEEERRALGWLKGWRRSEVGSVLQVCLF